MTDAAAHLRVGSLEVMLAFGAIALLASQPRRRVAREHAVVEPLRVTLDIVERGGVRTFAGLCPLVIGRGKDAALALSDVEVSRAHARIDVEDDVPFLRDLGSRNGTFLNGAPVSGAIEVRVDDEIDVGATRLIVREIERWV